MKTFAESPYYGPSPRARGSQPMKKTSILAHRSIPACAGEPPKGAWCKGFETVHPRVRGGARAINPLLSFAAGPSPRARGSHHG